MHCFKGIKKKTSKHIVSQTKITNLKTYLRTNPFQKRGDKYAKTPNE
ncbi:hypothetical protein bthur0014_23960 [Bacillus thuringiensis IBL 4222]|nr:hypothetical protein bthur0004_24110 [Bacillus thuringiensis serovar sotto str. T04001]EEN02896.1 hypothetical protein bthur0014_23960 [Bacillus thuringiensis IBL 4222]